MGGGRGDRLETLLKKQVLLAFSVSVGKAGVAQNVLEKSTVSVRWATMRCPKPGCRMCSKILRKTFVEGYPSNATILSVWTEMDARSCTYDQVQETASLVRRL